MNSRRTFVSIFYTLFFSFCTIVVCHGRGQLPQHRTKPNILWIFLEDTAPLLNCYGADLVSTPHIDNLAKQGVLYTNVFMPAPVCSASRSSIITGMMSTTIGAHNHHSSRTKEAGVYLPKEYRTIPEIFKEAGYFTFNNGKDDYNFIYNRRDLYSQDYKIHPLYGKSGVPIPMSELKEKQPFFGQVQLYGGKEIFSKNFEDNVKKPVDRSKVRLPPYLPDHPAIIEEYADHLDAIQITDRKVGDLIEGLRENGLLNNTVVFFFSDHGMRLTRNKQFLYDGGLHVPLIIADFTKKIGAIPAGNINSDLVSGLDLGTSALSLAEISIPSYMEGKNMFDGSYNREYVISTRDRCDFTIDRIRSVRSKEIKYIRNFMTDRPYSQPTYMDFDKIKFVGVMHRLHDEGKLNSVQDRFMSNARPEEELYDLEDDPYEINNLANDPKYKAELEKYRAILKTWISTTDDKGQYPEAEGNLKLMLGIWGDYAVNPEYLPLRHKYPHLSGSLAYLKNESAKFIDSSNLEEPLLELEKLKPIKNRK